MTPITVGILSGLLVVLILSMKKGLDKRTTYGLILSGIGFLYVGFTWTDLPELFATGLQAIAFLLLAYSGVKKSIYILIAGYFLHGCWDITYNAVVDSV